MSSMEPYEPTQTWQPPAQTPSQVVGPIGQPTPPTQQWQPAAVDRVRIRLLRTGRSPPIERDPGTAVIVLAWIAAVLTFGYMLPWAIAATRGRSNQAAIGIIDLLLGWTFVGWIVALVMACQAHQVVGQSGHTLVVAQNFAASPTVPPAGWYPAPTGLGQQYWDGAAWTSHWAP